MTTKVLIFSTQQSSSEAAFEASPNLNADPESFHTISDDYETHIGGGGRCTIRRVDERAKGYILNCGPRPLHVHYSLAETGMSVGPTTDYVYPGSFKEIGAAAGVLWHIDEAG